MRSRGLKFLGMFCSELWVCFALGNKWFKYGVIGREGG